MQAKWPSSNFLPASLPRTFAFYQFFLFLCRNFIFIKYWGRNRREHFFLCMCGAELLPILLSVFYDWQPQLDSKQKSDFEQEETIKSSFGLFPVLIDHKRAPIPRQSLELINLNSSWWLNSVQRKIASSSRICRTSVRRTWHESPHQSSRAKRLANSCHSDLLDSRCFN